MVVLISDQEDIETKINYYKNDMKKIDNNMKEIYNQIIEMLKACHHTTEHWKFSLIQSIMLKKEIQYLIEKDPTYFSNETKISLL